jgi:micrococcal nuclease
MRRSPLEFHKYLRVLWLLFLCTFAHSASPETLVGKVVRVADGDTLTILDGGNRQHKIRLSDIDAPESKQAFGRRSRESLAQICAGKSAK